MKSAPSFDGQEPDPSPELVEVNGFPIRSIFDWFCQNYMDFSVQTGYPRTAFCPTSIGLSTQSVQRVYEFSSLILREFVDSIRVPFMAQSLESHISTRF
ncbi:hypothetical protein P9112_010094 [Eukaryota sp. TZLM1-RC]